MLAYFSANATRKKLLTETLHQHNLKSMRLQKENEKEKKKKKSQRVVLTYRSDTFSTELFLAELVSLKKEG